MAKLIVLTAALCLAGCTPGEIITATTAPGAELPAGGDLLVLGDWGSGTSAQEEVARAMADAAEALDPVAIVTTGDNFYSDDAAALMEPYRWATARDIPFLITWGNHDIENANRVEIIDETFDDPPNWVVHEWGAVDLLLLDSNQVDSTEQVEFMTTVLESSSDPTIVVFHHPPYSCGAHGDTPSVKETWVPKFDDDVFLVLSGHEHNYQRFKIENVSYVVTGGGGRTLTELAVCSTDHPDRVAGASTHNFVTLEQERGEVSLTALDADGTVIDEVSLPLP